MQKEIADRWVAALRSGKYKQGRLQLRNLKDEYCCLGVLCDIQGAKFTLQSKEGIDYYGVSADLSSIKSSVGLHGSTRVLCDLKTSLGHFVVCELFENNLASLNDSGMSFDEIADIIEKNYDQL